MPLGYPGESGEREHAGSGGNNDSPAYGLSGTIAISATGNAVAFQSFASNLAPRHTNNAAEVCVRVF